MATGKGERDRTVSELHLLRHAKATPQGDGTDRERPLEQRGRRAAQAVAAWAAEHPLAPPPRRCSPPLRPPPIPAILPPPSAPPPPNPIEGRPYPATRRPP